MRLSGTLRSWNDDRGFGFIAPTHGGAELFLHISALPRDGTRPTVGETLTYELGRGKNGQPQAVKALRQAVGATENRPRASALSQHRSRSKLPKVIGLVIVLALAAYGYNQYEKRASRYSATPMPMTTAPERSPPHAADSTSVRCDGRTHCSQMTSCAEAKYFLKNCPGTQMDGNNDGVPCEQQWCTGPFAK